MAQFDLLITGGTIAGADGVGAGDVAVRDGRVAAVGFGLGEAASVIDATGRLVLPGGVDTHCHVEQVSGAGLLNADTFETASRSALFGGTTSFVSFAAQHPGHNLRTVVSDYRALAERGAICDYAFHVIVSDLSGNALTDDLPALMAQGYRSIKLFTVYDKVRVSDETILDVLWCARENGGIVCVHAENDGLIRWMTRKLTEAGKTEAQHHILSHPRAAEIEALNRLCLFSEFTGQPVMLFHVSTEEGAGIVRAARGRGVPVWAETCPHYLFMDAGIMERSGADPAGYVCSPPQRQGADQTALWSGLLRGDLQIVSSDHAPYRLDETGKYAHGRDVPFTRLANGMPGLETRLPLMFDALAHQGGDGLARFVDLTSTAPARIFGLETKGRIAPGADADIAIWNPDRSERLGALHDNTGYNPYEGRSVRGWPETVIRRGEVAISDGQLRLAAGSGRRIPMAKSAAMQPLPNAAATGALAS